MKAHPYAVWAVLAAMATAALIYLLHRFLGVDWVLAYLLALNLVTFLVFRYDKLASSGEGKRRVPNLLLAGLAVVGGSIGALLGIYRAKERHKTSSKYLWLRACVWVSLAAQVVLLGLYLFRWK